MNRDKCHQRSKSIRPCDHNAANTMASSGGVGAGSASAGHAGRGCEGCTQGMLNAGLPRAPGATGGVVGAAEGQLSGLLASNAMALSG